MDEKLKITINHTNKINRLYSRLDQILRLYIQKINRSTKFSVPKEMAHLKSAFDKKTSVDRKINVVEDVILDVIKSVDNSRYPDDILSTLEAKTYDTKRSLSKEKYPEKPLDQEIYDNYDFLLNHSKESLLKMEKSYFGRMKAFNFYFGNYLTSAFAIASFNGGFYGLSNESRISTLNKFGGNFKKGENLSEYLDRDTLAIRVAALEMVDKYISEVDNKYKKVNANNDFSNKITLKDLDYEILLMKIWILGNRAYNVCMRTVKEEPLQTILNTNNQTYLEEVTKVHKLKDTRSNKLKEMEHQAYLDNYTKKLEKKFEKQKAIKEGRPLKEEIDNQIMLPEIKEYLDQINNKNDYDDFDIPFYKKRSK